MLGIELPRASVWGEAVPFCRKRGLGRPDPATGASAPLRAGVSPGNTVVRGFLLLECGPDGLAQMSAESLEQGRTAVREPPMRGARKPQDDHRGLANAPIVRFRQSEEGRPPQSFAPSSPLRAPFINGASSPGCDGRFLARTQGVPVSGDTGTTEDAARGRPARLGGSVLHCERGS